MLSDEEYLLQAFPKLAETGFVKRSDSTRDYNCVAFAAGDTSQNWWPETERLSGTYWPVGAALTLTIEAFAEAFGTLGYEPCADGRLESAFEKVALYTRGGEPTHMVRQLVSGNWVCKPGPAIDVEHRFDNAFEGHVYGSVTHYFRRLRVAPQG